MEGWREVSRLPGIGSIDGDPPASFTALKFDSSQNLLWCGDSTGLTRSLTTQIDGLGFQQIQLYPYTKFPVTDGSPIIQHLAHKDGILSLSHNEVLYNNRRGIVKESFTRDLYSKSGVSFRNLTCMSMSSIANNDLVVGGQESLFKVDINKANIITSYDHSGDLSFVENTAKCLVLGKTSGSIEIFDPTAQKVIKSLPGHSGILSDLSVSGNYVATCGYSVKRMYYGTTGEYLADSLVNLYDLRMLKALPPMPFPSGASFVRFHPKLPNIIIIASTSGQIQFIDMFDQSKGFLYQADLSTINGSTPNVNFLSNLEISSNGEFITFMDSSSSLHLWSYNPTSRDFSNFPVPIEQPDIVVPPPSQFENIDDNIPLSSIGMPYYKELLLSNFPSNMKFTKELAKIPRQSKKLMDNSHGIFFPYDRAEYGPRNIVENYKSVKDGDEKPIIFPKFLSEKSGSYGDNGDTYIEDESNTPKHEDESVFRYKIAPTEGDNSIFNQFKTPNSFSKLSIRYSRFGVEDFDFDYYNRSRNLYCGLENHQENSYINSLIQLYRHTPLIYNSITTTLINEWLPNDTKTIITNAKGSSILNELGYLFDMMFKAQGKNVTISNFSDTLKANAIAIQEGLIDINEGRTMNGPQLRRLIGKFNTFLLNHLDYDLINQFEQTSIRDIFKLSYELDIKGTVCPIYEKQTGSQFVIDLITPPFAYLRKSKDCNVNNDLSIDLEGNSIITYLEYSLNNMKSVPCQIHGFEHNLAVYTSILKLPPLLSINIHGSVEEFKIIAAMKQWLVPEFYACKVSDRMTFMKFPSEDITYSVKYSLKGYVCEVSHSNEDSIGSHNLVSFVNIDGKWILFNDFLVMPIPEEEVFNLNYQWKKPVVLLYTQEDHPYNQSFDYFEAQSFSKLKSLNDSIIYKDHFAGAIREGYKKEYELLTRDEAPEVGTLVAIDAEFVKLQPEEVEVSYDGKKNIIYPKKLSLARISVLRGDDGPQEGKPFIDDYIVHTTGISDYLTSFSGIEPGDLDPTNSKKNLVTLQTAYRRLWLLLNLGAVFVGHGLQSDFRCINLQVPPRQVRDTANFFYKSDFKRKLSLKFLAYVLLREKVQIGNHDSIEDAMTALLLYKKYLELKQKGIFDFVLGEIYAEGQLLRFRVPDN